MKLWHVLAGLAVVGVIGGGLWWALRPEGGGVTAAATSTATTAPAVPGAARGAHGSAPGEVGKMFERAAVLLGGGGSIF